MIEEKFISEYRYLI